jgi:hypothetical protein
MRQVVANMPTTLHTVLELIAPRHIDREIRHLNSVALAGLGLEAKKDVSFCEDAASASAVVAATPVLAFFALGPV